MVRKWVHNAPGLDNLASSTSSTKFLSAESVSGEPPWAAGARGDLALLLLEDVPVGCTKGIRMEHDGTAAQATCWVPGILC